MSAPEVIEVKAGDQFLTTRVVRAYCVPNPNTNGDYCHDIMSIDQDTALVAFEDRDAYKGAFIRVKVGGTPFILYVELSALKPVKPSSRRG